MPPFLRVYPGGSVCRRALQHRLRDVGAPRFVESPFRPAGLPGMPRSGAGSEDVILLSMRNFSYTQDFQG